MKIKNSINAIDFQFIKKNGVSITLKYGWFKFVKRYKKTSFSIIISKKNIKLATNRNKLKRRFRAAIQREFAKRDVLTNIKCAFYYIYTKSDILTYQNIENEIKELFNKIESE